MSHLYGFSPVWPRRWRSRWCLNMVEYGQCGHLNRGLLKVCRTGWMIEGGDDKHPMGSDLTATNSNGGAWPSTASDLRRSFSLRNLLTVCSRRWECVSNKRFSNCDLARRFLPASFAITNCISSSMMVKSFSSSPMARWTVPTRANQLSEWCWGKEGKLNSLRNNLRFHRYVYYITIIFG